MKTLFSVKSVTKFVILALSTGRLTVYSAMIKMHIYGSIVGSVNARTATMSLLVLHKYAILATKSAKLAIEERNLIVVDVQTHMLQ